MNNKAKQLASLLVTTAIVFTVTPSIAAEQSTNGSNSSSKNDLISNQKWQWDKQGRQQHKVEYNRRRWQHQNKINWRHPNWNQNQWHRRQKQNHKVFIKRNHRYFNHSNIFWNNRRSYQNYFPIVNQRNQKHCPTSWYYHPQDNNYYCNYNNTSYYVPYSNNYGYYEDNTGKRVLLGVTGTIINELLLPEIFGY
ncbi:hypothetical protein HC766_06215 [Candidatus Gracilibacteria bacterium]|nr:hypothetical protein [Candidatus Gracilibacteria bacterium]NJS41876.1 hypothetical protein [Candidatus Gracilibacteria bacterium]